MVDYPKGAIRSIEELETYSGKTVYMSSIYNKSISEVQFLKTGSLVMFNKTNHYTPEKEANEHKWMLVYIEKYKVIDIRSLKDCNVIENDYNDWFVFHNIDDAIQYSKQDLMEEMVKLHKQLDKLQQVYDEVVTSINSQKSKISALHDKIYNKKQ